MRKFKGGRGDSGRDISGEAEPGTSGNSDVLCEAHYCSQMNHICLEQLQILFLLYAL